VLRLAPGAAGGPRQGHDALDLFMSGLPTQVRPRVGGFSRRYGSSGKRDITKLSLAGRKGAGRRTQASISLRNSSTMFFQPGALVAALDAHPLKRAVGHGHDAVRRDSLNIRVLHSHPVRADLHGPAFGCEHGPAQHLAVRPTVPSPHRTAVGGS